MFLAKSVCAVDGFIAQQCKGLEIRLNLEDIDDKLTDAMRDLFFKKQGGKDLNFNIFAAHEHSDLLLFSSHKIDISHRILTSLMDSGILFSLK